MFDHLAPKALRDCLCLRNRYFAMRHGRASSNDFCILAGDPQVALTQYGLTENGESQVRQAASQWLAKSASIPLPSVVFASDYLRASQTASLLIKALRIDSPVRLDRRLRERYWGLFENTPEDNCVCVYDQDRHNACASFRGAESVTAMIDRLSSLIMDIEAEFSGEMVLLVSHCDPIQVLELIFTGQAVQHYIDFPPFPTASVKELTFLTVAL